MVGQYQKGKTNLDFTEARDSEWQWHQLGHNASLHLAPDRQPHQHPTMANMVNNHSEYKVLKIQHLQRGIKR